MSEDQFSMLMFLLTGLGVGHVAYKVSDGEIEYMPSMALAVATVMFGALGSRFAGMTFYLTLGQMVVGIGVATTCFLTWQQLRD